MIYETLLTEQDGHLLTITLNRPHAGNALNTAMLARVDAIAGGAVPLIGLGGVASGADAYAKIRAGASAVQLYTALIYSGTALVTRIKRELAVFLMRDGFSSVADATGADRRGTRSYV